MYPVQGSEQQAFSGNYQRDKPEGMNLNASVGSPFFVANTRADEISDITATLADEGLRLYEILGGLNGGNFSGGAVPTKAGNILLVDNPHRLPFLDICIAFRNATATTGPSTFPIVRVLGRVDPIQLNNALRPCEVDSTASTGFPNSAAGAALKTGIPFDNQGMWAYCPSCKPDGSDNFDPGTNELKVDLAGTVPMLLHPFATDQVTIDSKYVQHTCKTVRTYGSRTLVVPVSVAAVFSATTRSLILGRLRTS